MKIIFSFIFCFAVIIGNCHAAQQLLTSPNYLILKIGFSLSQVEKALGTPHVSTHDQNIYQYSDGTKLTVTFEQGTVSSILISYKYPVKLTDLSDLIFLQKSTQNTPDFPGWFYVGKPQKGLIYRINTEGKAQSLTIVAPFVYKASTPRQFQALLRNFQDVDSPLL